MKASTSARAEDRRSCHNISFVLGLAVAARDAATADLAFLTMLTLVSQVAGQKPN